MAITHIYNDELIKAILNIYSSVTKTPIVLVYNNKVLWQVSRDYCSPYCRYLSKLNPDLCRNDHIKRSKLKEPTLTICHAGLWNYVIPIKQRGEVVGALLTGQRRLKNKDEESFRVVEKFKQTLSNEEYSQLEKNFKETCIIEGFDIESLNTLKLIEERIYDHLKAQELERKRLLNLAHDLLLPMQSIIANSENLFEYLLKKNDEQASRAEEIMNQVSILSINVDNMRANLQGMPEERQDFGYHDIKGLLINISSIFKYEAISKNVLLNINMEKYGIRMSKQSISRAFYNLIHNAIKYSYTGSAEKPRHVDIIGKPKSNYYLITISNYGIGILEEELEKVFNEGYRGILSYDRERSGSGIGLFEAKKIIESHRGTIKIESILVGDNIYYGPYKINVNIRLPIDQYGQI